MLARLRPLSDKKKEGIPMGYVKPSLDAANKCFIYLRPQLEFKIVVCINREPYSYNPTDCMRVLAIHRRVWVG